MGERTLNFGTDATDADYQIRDSDPAGGDLIIEHQPTGATFEYDATENAWVPTDPIGSTNRRAPGVVADSVDAQSASIGETNRVIDAKQWMDDNGLGDIAAAANDAFAYLKSNYRGGRVVVPTGAWTISEPIVFPDLSAPGGGLEAPGSFELVGHGQRATKLIPGSSFPSSSYIVESNPSTDSNFGFRIANLWLEDDIDVIGAGGGGIRLTNTKQSIINNVLTEVETGDHACLIEGGGQAIKNKIHNCNFAQAENNALTIDVAGGPAAYLSNTDLGAKDTVSGATALNYVNGERLMGNMSIEGGDIGMKIAGDEATLNTRFEAIATNQLIYFAPNSKGNVVKPRTVPADTVFQGTRNEGVHNRIIDESGFRVRPVIDAPMFTETKPPDELQFTASDSGSLGSPAKGMRISTGTTDGSAPFIRSASFRFFNEVWFHTTVNNLTATDVVVQIRLENGANDYAGLLFDTTNATSSTNWLFDAQTGGSDPPGGAPIDTGITADDARFNISVCVHNNATAGERRVGLGIWNANNVEGAFHEFDVQISPTFPKILIDNTPSSGVDKSIDVSRFTVDHFI